MTWLDRLLLALGAGCTAAQAVQLACWLVGP